MKTKQLEFERVYDAPIERVWKALTDKDHMKAWYFDIADFRPEPGFEFSFTGGKDDEPFVHHCRVVEVNPPNKLSYTWTYEGYPGQSLVTFELDEPTPRKTRLTLTHRDIDTFPAGNDSFAPSSFSEGWNFILGESLRNFVETASFERSEAIKASLNEVWEVLLNPNGHWGNAFGGGALVQETGWKEGSQVIWTDLEGNPGANGVVTTYKDRETLEFSYYDDPEPEPEASLGEYIERFKLRTVEDGRTLLTIEIDGLGKMYQSMHAEMWEKALRMIKDKAEKHAN